MIDRRSGAPCVCEEKYSGWLDVSAPLWLVQVNVASTEGGYGEAC